MKYKVKMIVGFRRDQEHSIDSEEVHKAYYLFLHPNERGIFNNGLAIIGSQIQEIVPDYHGTMGWNSSHILDSNDWNEIRSKGVERKMRDLLSSGKDFAQTLSSSELNKPLSFFVHQPQIEASLK